MTDTEKYLKLKIKQGKLVKKLNKANSKYENKINELKKAKRKLKVKKLIPYILALGIGIFDTKIFSGGYPFITDQKEAFAYFDVNVDENGQTFVIKKGYVTSEEALPEAKICKKDLVGNLEKTTIYQDPELSVFDFQKAISEGKLEELFDTFTIKDEYNDTMLLEKSAYPEYDINLYEINKKDTKFVDEKPKDNSNSNSLFTLVLIAGFSISIIEHIRLNKKSKQLNGKIDLKEEKHKEVEEELKRKLTKTENKIASMDYSRKKYF